MTPPRPAGHAPSGVGSGVVGRVVRGRGELAVLAWSVALALLLLGPALGPGYALTYDMVWVPDLALRADSWGLGSGLPRAVPSDAVVGSLDEIVPGAWLQDVVLLGSLVAGGLGAARLVPRRTGARLVAVALWQWNPFVVERLVIGHWPVLVGYGVLPWVLLAGRRWREEGRFPARLGVLMPLASLSASAGIAGALALLVTAGRRRHWGAVLAVGAVANAPWVTAGLLHAARATSGPVDSSVFALSGEGSVPAPLAALTLGGIWNAEAVPGSRDGPLGWVALVVLAGLAALGSRPWWRSTPARDRRSLVALWCVGYALAVLTWLAPGLLEVLTAAVPGGALLRDGARLLLLCAPLLVVLVVRGAVVVIDRLPVLPVARVAAWGTVALLSVALVPDAALGVSGRVQSVAFPAGWAEARQALVDAEEAGVAEGDALILPRGGFRRFGWNDDRTVLDPTGRYLPPVPVVDDVLVVDGRPLGAEDPRAARALEIVDPSGRAVPGEGAVAALHDLGIGVLVVVEEAAAADRARGAVTSLPGATVVASGAGLTVAVLPLGAERTTPRWWAPVMVAAWAAFLALPVAALVTAAYRRRRIGPSPRQT